MMVTSDITDDPYSACETILVGPSYAAIQGLSDETWERLGARLPRETQRIGTSPECPPDSVYLMPWADWKQQVGLG